jgi:hypothetical protein
VLPEGCRGVDTTVAVWAPRQPDWQPDGVQSFPVSPRVIHRALSGPYRALLVLALVLRAAALLTAAPVTTHPRLLFRAEDLPNLRARMAATNDAWVAFKEQVVDKCLRDWKCSSVSEYKTNLFYLSTDAMTGIVTTNYYSGWVRTQFTDEFGQVHNPGDADWGQYASDSERPAAPEDDLGEPTGNVRLFSEQYAMIFAFMARLLKDDPTPAVQLQRAEYVTAAKECLFTVVNEAHKGIANLPWRAPNFAQNDRSFAAESFALTVDWMYEDFTTLELAKLRKAFLIWAEESNDHIYFAPHKSGGQHGPVNSTDLLRLDDPVDGPQRYEVRLALNNHYANHARQLVLYSLAFDPKDDVPVTLGSPADGVVDDTAPAGSLTSHTVPAGQPDQWIQQPFGVLRDTLGVWLYLMDYAYRHDGAGGISMEGTQYASNGLGPAALMMEALHTAGQDDVAKWGPQVSLAGHPFWSRAIPAYLAMLTPRPRIPGYDTGENYQGAIFQPPLTGDLETYLYLNNQYIKVLAPMALYDASVNGSSGQIVQAVRYIQRYLAPGGLSRFEDRMNSTRANKALRDAIYTFLVFDPAAPVAADPRPALQAKTFYSSRTVNGNEMGFIAARSGPATNDTYFYTHLDWVGIDHIRGDSMTFGLWKNGLWLTKPMTGYGVLQGCSDYRNSLSLGNGVPTSTPVGEDIAAEHGSQWNYSALGDPQYLARSFGQNFLYVNQDGTALYQHRQQTQLREVTHASRRMVWLKPDVLVIHDVARSKTAGFFKRVYINTPEIPQITGNVAHASAKEDGVPQAELFVTQLLPAGATMQVTDIASGMPAYGEDMKARLFTEAPGNPQEAHFLHVVQGAAAGTVTPIATQGISSASGAAFEGTVVGTSAVLFRQDPEGTGDAFSYSVPDSVTQHYVTGLSKSAGFNVNLVTAAGQTTVTITPGGTQAYTDSGGVLLLGGSEPATVDIAVTDANGAEQGSDPIVFEFHRNGDVSAPLTVNLNYTGAATATDFVGAPNSVTFAAGSPIATLTLTPVDDSEFEGEESVVLQIAPDAAYHASDVLFEAAATLVDNDAPAGGYLQFASTDFTANEADGSASITVKRVGGTAGAVSAQITASGLLPASQPVNWADGDASDQVVSFQVVNDAVYTGDKTVALNLSSVIGGAAAGSPKTATLTILDDEPAPPGQITFAFGSTNVTEAAGQFTVYVSRVNGKGGAVTANLLPSGGASLGVDYTVSPSTLNWADNDHADKAVTITILQDNAYEGPSESFTLTLSLTAGAATLGSTPALTTTITEDDPQPQDYDVGDGFPYLTIGSVPWKNLGPGAVVRIHHRAAPYHEKILVSTRGSAAEPIKVIGIAGPNGEKPVIDGANATAGASLGYESSSYTPQMSVVAVARGANTPVNGKAGYVEISGLEVRNTTDQSFTNLLGQAEAYYSSSGAIYLRGAEHVVIRDCELHHAWSGLVAENYGTESEVNRDVLIERCYFHDNTRADAYSGHNAQLEAIGITVQFCRFDANLNRDKNANIRDGSAGAVYRYNLIEGGSYLFELDQPTGAIALVTADAGYATTHLYGNTLINRNGDGSSLVRFGSVYYDTSNARPLLHFYHNTVVMDTPSTGRAVFSLALPETTVETRNNVFYASSGQFQMINNPGVINLGVNWANTGWSTGSGTVNGAANLLTGANPGFMNYAGNDFHPTAVSVLRNAAGSLAAGVPAIDAQYLTSARNEPRPSAVDLGAFAFSQPSAGNDTVHYVRSRPIKIPAATLLANDSSPLGLTLTVLTADASSLNGGVARLQGGWLIYEPALGVFTDDTLHYTATDGIRQASATITLVADSEPDSVTQNITATQVVPAGGGSEIHLTVAGIPGRSYQLQITSDLTSPVSWANLGPITMAPASGGLELVDPSPTAPRFYRVIEATGP